MSRNLVYRLGMNTTQFLVQKNQLQNTELRHAPELPLADGQVRIGIDKFALTSNNITYAAFGDAMNYWHFFPVAPQANSAADGAAVMGLIPVWGFGMVLEARHAGVAVGERLYGYFPMASQVILQPVRATPAGFYDGAPHRAELHSVYNNYLRCSADPYYTPESEAVQALLRPLFTTSWLIDDFMADNAFFGAEQTGTGSPGVALLSSASSKTAYGTAFMLKERAGVEVVGLTSPGNVAFCESLGCYSRVLTYDQLDQIAADRACVYIDFAGNAALRLAIHSRFVNLKYSCSIGGTHVENLGGARDLPGPRATLFFAPAQIKKRAADWGPASLNERLVKAWFAFAKVVCNPAKPWLTVVHHTGVAQVQGAYAHVLQGKGDPREGHILSLGSPT